MTEVIMNNILILIAAAKIVFIFTLVLSFVPILIWLERKGAAYIQDRRGPNRASILGIRLGGVIHSLADALKLFFKEELIAGPSFKPLFYLAPIVAFFVATATMAIIPFTENILINGQNFCLQIANLEVGLIYVFALSALGVFATLMAGWAACGKYSVLGALRASSQMISYELAMGLAVLSIFLLAGSLNLQDIISDQGPQVWRWNIVRQPLAFIIFLVALFAETNRLPFDLAEAESELVAGYHTEYSSMKFALFFMSEYAHMIIGSLIIATLFLGGWQIPFISSDFLFKHADQILFRGSFLVAILLVIIGSLLMSRFQKIYQDLRDYEPVIIGGFFVLIGLALLAGWIILQNMGFWQNLPAWAGAVSISLIQLGVMLFKAFIFCLFFIWVRWTLPRFRYDQLMRLGWKMMIPLGIVNTLVTSAVIVFG
ncbi:MAG: complex I subunit 1 family protein [Pseudomonadota bacterium]